MSHLARLQKVAPLPVLAEHLLIIVLAFVIAHFIGVWIRRAFA